MLGLKRTSSGVADKPATKAKRYVYKYYYDARANRGRGGFVKATKAKTDVNYRR